MEPEIEMMCTENGVYGRQAISRWKEIDSSLKPPERNAVLWAP